MKNIEFQLSQKQYINASLVILFKRPVIWIAPVMMLFILIPRFLNPNPGNRFGATDFFLIYLIIYFLLLPIITYFRAKKFYDMPSLGVKERVQIEFQENLYVERAETAYFEANWNRIYKVAATKNWVYIYTNPLVPTPIPKKAIWEGELLRLREILDANKIPHNFQ